MVLVVEAAVVDSEVDAVAVRDTQLYISIYSDRSIGGYGGGRGGGGYGGGSNALVPTFLIPH